MFAALLHASDPARNRRRAYWIEAGRDLFGTWLVQATFARIGSRGRTRTFVASDKGAARGFARTCLLRRRSAPQRIGVAYELRELLDAAGRAASLVMVGDQAHNLVTVTR